MNIRINPYFIFRLCCAILIFLIGYGLGQRRAPLQLRSMRFTETFTSDMSKAIANDPSTIVVVGKGCDIMANTALVKTWTVIK
jgi:hypothetical protein